jgi:hypothetical protein
MIVVLEGHRVYTLLALARHNQHLPSQKIITLRAQAYQPNLLYAMM